jgi:signal transduction histidine kinase
LEFLNRFLDRSLKHQGVDYLRRSRILVDASIAILLFNFTATATLFGPLREFQLGGATLVVLCVGILVLPALRLTGSVSVAGNLLLGQTWALLHMLTLYSGKIQGVPPAWIIFLPVLAIHICNKGSAVVWTVLATVEIFTVAWLAFQGGHLTGGSLLLYLATHLGLLALMVSTAYLNARFKDQTLGRLSSINKELSVARDRALEASRAKSAFVANMSHELRTPLNAVIGYSEMLAEDAEAVGPDQLKEDLQRIRSSGQHLLELINELLEFSKLEAGAVTLSVETFRVEQLIQELVATMEREASKNGNKLVFESRVADSDSRPVRTDPMRLRQCLYNLLSNACKFTRDGRVTVTLQEREECGDTGVVLYDIEVKDEGIGMTNEQLERVFEPFVQAEESISRRFGGTGLGLSVSRRLAEALHGQLEGFSVAGQGSRFVLTFPSLSKRFDSESNRSTGLD